MERLYLSLRHPKMDLFLLLNSPMFLIRLEEILFMLMTWDNCLTILRYKCLHLILRWKVPFAAHCVKSRPYGNPSFSEVSPQGRKSSITQWGRNFNTRGMLDSCNRFIYSLFPSFFFISHLRIDLKLKKRQKKVWYKSMAVMGPSLTGVYHYNPKIGRNFSSS